jgi:hypothetical protein
MPLQYTAIRPSFSRRLLRWSAVFAQVILLAGCGDANSPEQQVRDVIGKMELAAEARDVGDLMEHLSEDYRDPNGLGAQEAARYARGYFIANQSIHLLTRVEEIEFPTAGEARAKVLVGMVGRDADALGESFDLANLAADLYEFKIALRREDDEWKVSFAEWSRR